VAALTALFDACVLYPQTLRDLLLNLARTDFTGKSTWTVVAIQLGFRPHQDFQNTNRSQIKTCSQ